MDGELVISLVAIIAGLFLAIIALLSKLAQKKTAENIQKLPLDQREAIDKALADFSIIKQEQSWGPINKAMVCPLCQCRGKIRTKAVKRRKGVSGGKATAAIFTAGISTLATGLSRMEKQTQAHCDNCNNTWTF